MIFNFIKQNKLFSIYSFSVILIICIAVLAPVLVPHDPYEANMLKALQTPNNEYFLGTDKLGRDIFSRIIYGMQISLFMTILHCDFDSNYRFNHRYNCWLFWR